MDKQWKEDRMLERRKLQQNEYEKTLRRNEKQKEQDRLDFIEKILSVTELEEKLLKEQRSTVKLTERAELSLLRDQLRSRTGKKIPLTVKGKKKKCNRAERGGN